MQLVLNDEQKDVYLLLNQLEENDIFTFCKESIRVLKSGSSTEIAEGLARKCGLSKDQVQSILEHLMLIFSFLTRFKMNESDLQKLIAKQLNNESTEKVRKTMCEFYRSHHAEIQAIITEQTYLNTNIVPRFQDFSWRLQVQLASRATSSMPGGISTSASGDLATDELAVAKSANGGDNVSVLLRFKLRKLNTDDCDYVLIECDLNQLAIFQQTLDQAIKEIKLKKAWINADFD